MDTYKVCDVIYKNALFHLNLSKKNMATMGSSCLWMTELQKSSPESSIQNDLLNSPLNFAMVNNMAAIGNSFLRNCKFAWTQTVHE